MTVPAPPARNKLFALGSAARASVLARVGARGEALPGGPPPRPPLGEPTTRADLAMMRAAGAVLGIESPYFRPHDGRAGGETSIHGQTMLNFASYNYLGLSGRAEVNDAAQAAIDRYGTSVSASRLVSGERPVHAALEAALARVYGAQDCLTLVSGHATNVTLIGCLVGAGDGVVHDALAHNSIVQGAMLSGAQRLAFPHNDLDVLDSLLAGLRGKAARVLVVVEGHYSMDGTIPDLARLIDIVRRHGAWLMVDEAHALGVLGAGGRGIAEHCGVDPAGVDLWMGTLSKTLAGCGGYVAGSADLIDYLRCAAPGFVYSVGLAPPLAAASLAALDLMLAEPALVTRLAANGQRFRAHAQAAGLDTGGSIGSAIVPVMLGSSIAASRAAQALFQRGINVQPILYPAVPERSARLRFFLSAEHTADQIDHTVAATAQAVAEALAQPVPTAALAAALARA